MNRQEAIDILSTHYEPDDQRLVQAFDMAIEALKEPHWIPYSERMPEEGQACLVSARGSILIDIYIGHGNPYNWRWYVKDYEAWMPLPEPYKADMRGEEE